MTGTADVDAHGMDLQYLQEILNRMEMLGTPVH